MKPYTTCPQCHEQKLGTLLSSSPSSDFYIKKCLNCKCVKRLALPKIVKKIIYLDQFVISDIAKSLDLNHPRHSAVDPFWIELYKKLDVAIRAQLIACPDSYFHKEESLNLANLEAQQSVYEHLSGGLTFHHYNDIMMRQIVDDFKNYLDQKPNIKIPFDTQDVIRGEINAWRSHLMTSILFKPTQEEINRHNEEKSNKYKILLEIFERWKSEDKTFDVYLTEEINGFLLGILSGVKNYCEKMNNMTVVGQPSYDECMSMLYPPFSINLFRTLNSLSSHLSNSNEVVQDYLLMKRFEIIPSIYISSLMYASFAHDVSQGGKKRKPTTGTVTDVDMISSLAPYCDLMFLDQENEEILNRPKIQKRLKIKTIFVSMRDKKKILDYLDELLNSITPEHRAILDDKYGANWDQPYMDVLN